MAARPRGQETKRWIQARMALILSGLSLLLAVFPMLVLLAVVWWSDRFDREPLWLVLLTFLWGGIGGAGLSLLLNTSFSVVTGLLGPLVAPFVSPAAFQAFVGPAIGAPLFEEPTKALFLLFVAWNGRPNDMSSGFLYGAAAGIGFATTENFFYFTNASVSLESLAYVVLIRTLYCSFLHLMCSSLVGATFGFGRLRGWGTTAVTTSIGLACAMALHALWNGLHVLNDFTSVDLSMVNFIALPGEVLLVGFIWQLSLLDDAWSMRRELRSEGLEPEHVATITSSFKKLFANSIPNVPIRDAYIRTATLLARRKRHIGLLGGRATDFHHDDLERLRTQMTMQRARMDEQQGLTSPV